MKKLLAILLVLAVLCSAPSVAFAAKMHTGPKTSQPGISDQEKAALEQQISEQFVFDWSESEAVIKEENIAGRFVTFDEIDVKLWLPDFYEDLLEDSDREQGYIGYYMTEEPEDDGEYGVVDVMYWDAGCSSAEEYKDALLGWGYDTAEIVEVNGWEAVLYFAVEDGYDYMAVALATEAGKIFEVSVHPISDENYLAVAYLILSSIQET